MVFTQVIWDTFRKDGCLTCRTDWEAWWGGEEVDVGLQGVRDDGKFWWCCALGISRGELRG